MKVTGKGRSTHPYREMGNHLFKSKKLLDVLEYGIEAPVKIALQLENFYILPSREKARGGHDVIVSVEKGGKAAPLKIKST